MEVDDAWTADMDGPQAAIRGCFRDQKVVITRSHANRRHVELIDNAVRAVRHAVRGRRPPPPCIGEHLYCALYSGAVARDVCQGNTR